MLLSIPHQIIPKLNAEAGLKSLEHEFSMEQIHLITRVDGDTSVESLATLLDRPLFEIIDDIKVLIRLDVLQLYKRLHPSGQLELLADLDGKTATPPVYGDSGLAQMVQEAVAEKEARRRSRSSNYSLSSEGYGSFGSLSGTHAVGGRGSFGSLPEAPVIRERGSLSSFPEVHSARDRGSFGSLSGAPEALFSPPTPNSTSEPIETTAIELPSLSTFSMEELPDLPDNATVAEVKMISSYDLPAEMKHATMAEVQTILSQLSTATPPSQKRDVALGRTVYELVSLLSAPSVGESEQDRQEPETDQKVRATKQFKALSALPYDVVVDLLGANGVTLHTLEATGYTKDLERSQDNLASGKP